MNEAGQQQAQMLAERLAGSGIQYIFTSPLERARETAEPLALRLNIPLRVSEPLIEVDFGDWTGKAFAELDQLELWKKWNTLRSAGRVPNGESMIEVQARIVGEIERIRRAFPNDRIALLSHGDPIRAAITYYLGMPLDMLLRIEVSSASVTAFSVDDWQIRFDTINFR